MKKKTFIPVSAKMLKKYSFQFYEAHDKPSPLQITGMTPYSCYQNGFKAGFETSWRAFEDALHRLIHEAEQTRK